MKTKEELARLKKEFASFTSKLQELSEDELKLVTGGAIGEWNNAEHSDIHVNDQVVAGGGQHQR